MEKSSQHIKLVISEEKEPKVALQAGMKLNVVSVQLVDPELKPGTPVAKASLCGGTDTCVAIVELGKAE